MASSNSYNFKTATPGEIPNEEWKVTHITTAANERENTLWSNRSIPGQKRPGKVLLRLCRSRPAVQKPFEKPSKCTNGSVNSQVPPKITLLLPKHIRKPKTEELHERVNSPLSVGSFPTLGEDFSTNAPRKVAVLLPKQIRKSKTEELHGRINSPLFSGSSTTLGGDFSISAPPKLSLLLPKQIPKPKIEELHERINIPLSASPSTTLNDSVSTSAPSKLALLLPKQIPKPKTEELYEMINAPFLIRSSPSDDSSTESQIWKPKKEDIYAIMNTPLCGDSSILCDDFCESLEISQNSTECVDLNEKVDNTDSSSDTPDFDEFESEVFTSETSKDIMWASALQYPVQYSYDFIILKYFHERQKRFKMPLFSNN